MALVHLNFESHYLYNNTDVNIILPDMPRTDKPKDFYRSGKKYKVLWLLHGTFGDYTDWIRKSNVELYACEKDVIIVMPSALNSDYVDWHNFAMGYNMYSYMTEELMPLIYGWYPASDKREDNFIAGLSMGGAGTALYALNHPELFAGAYVMSSSPRHYSDTSLSGTQFAGRAKNVIENAGGMEAYLNSYQNTWDLVKKRVEEKADLPEMVFACGTSDTLVYKSFKAFEKYANEVGLKADFIEVDGYTHEWRFWDLCIQDCLNRFAPKEENAGNALI